MFYSTKCTSIIFVFSKTRMSSLCLSVIAIELLATKNRTEKVGEQRSSLELKMYVDDVDFQIQPNIAHLVALVGERISSD